LVSLLHSASTSRYSIPDDIFFEKSICIVVSGFQMFV